MRTAVGFLSLSPQVCRSSHPLLSEDAENALRRLHEPCTLPKAQGSGRGSRSNTLLHRGNICSEDLIASVPGRQICVTQQRRGSVPGALRAAPLPILSTFPRVSLEELRGAAACLADKLFAQRFEGVIYVRLFIIVPMTVNCHMLAARSKSPHVALGVRSLCRQVPPAVTGPLSGRVPACSISPGREDARWVFPTTTVLPVFSSSGKPWPCHQCAVLCADVHPWRLRPGEGLSGPCQEEKRAHRPPLQFCSISLIFWQTQPRRYVTVQNIALDKALLTHLENVLLSQAIFHSFLFCERGDWQAGAARRLLPRTRTLVQMFPGPAATGSPLAHRPAWPLQRGLRAPGLEHPRVLAEPGRSQGDGGTGTSAVATSFSQKAEIQQ